MEKYEELPEEIFDLFSNNRFSNLTEDQKAQVLHYMNAKEFDSYASVVQDFQSMDAGLNMDMPEPTNNTEHKPFLKRLLNYRMPLYQVAASLIICILATSVIHDEIKNTSGAPTDISIENIGVSLANDDYPEELIFDL